MSSRAGNSLGRKRVEQLLRAVGSQPAEDAARVDFAEYDWNDPHYFNGEQLAKLDSFARSAAQAMATKFSDFCRSRYDVTITSITQHFAGEYLGKASEGEQNDYSVPFGATPERSCGLIGMPEQTASAWARQLLGDSESDEESSRALSSLEESLLLDLTSALIEALSESSSACSFCMAGDLVKGPLPVDAAATEEICRISFDVKKADAEEGSAAYFVIPCKELAPATGKTVPGGEFSVNEISTAILDNLQEVKVTVTAQLDSAKLTFEELINLRVNDMLLLDKTVAEPIELIVEGKTLFSGRPAKSTGKYAVVVAAVLDGDAT
jgi:flagellar motor switch protein FliM